MRSIQEKRGHGKRDCVLKMKDVQRCLLQNIDNLLIKKLLNSNKKQLHSSTAREHNKINKHTYFYLDKRLSCLILFSFASYPHHTNSRYPKRKYALS